MQQNQDDNVYFIFTNQELKELRHWSNDKTNKVKKELEDANLLLQKRMGFNPKTGKNEPNRLYLADLEVTATDVYQKHANEQESAKPLGNSGSAEMRHNLDKTNKPLDTNRYNIDTTSLDFSNKKYTAEQLEQQNQDLMTHAQEFLTDQASYPTFLNQEGIDLLGKWCNTPKELHRFIGIILNARKDDHTIHTTTENYLYGTFKHLFADIANDILNEQWQKEDERNEQAFLANVEQQLNNKQ
ncbi:hypothetical protein [Tetragenococcus muriaticus]|nr:hypothetical protein [Tetragenococcus muriaticus]